MKRTMEGDNKGVLIQSSVSSFVQADAVNDIREVESGCDKEGMAGGETTMEC